MASPRGRPRRIDDTHIVAAAIAIVLQDGPASLTFARLAAAVKMAPGSLAHRFGSRDNLISEVSRAITSGVENRCREAAEGEGGVAAVRKFLLGLLPVNAKPSTVINQLALLQMELTTTRLRERVRRRSHAVRSTLVKMLKQAIERGEIAGVSPGPLADMLQQLMVGTQLCWSMRPQGPLHDKVASELTFLLEQFTST